MPLSLGVEKLENWNYINSFGNCFTKKYFFQLLTLLLVDTDQLQFYNITTNSYVIESKPELLILKTFARIYNIIIKKEKGPCTKVWEPFWIILCYFLKR